MRGKESSCGLIRSFLNLIWSHFCNQPGEKNRSPKDTFNEYLCFFSFSLQRLSSEFMLCLLVPLRGWWESCGGQSRQPSKGSPVTEAQGASH